MSGSYLDDRRKWQNTTLTAVLNAFGMPMNAAINGSVQTVSIWPSILSACLGFVSIFYLWSIRNRSSPRIISIVYLANTFSVTAAFHMANASFASTMGTRWVPFQGDKLGTFVGALLAPTPLTGFLSILAHVVSATGQYLTFTSEIREQIAVGEPWAMFAFGLTACVLMVSRFARIRLEHRVNSAESEKLALMRSAEMFRNVKDLMNTPLQTLGILVAVLQEKKIYDQKIITDMERSLSVLNSFNQALAKYEKAPEPDSIQNRPV